IGHKRGLVSAIALRSIVTLLCAVAGSAWQLYLIRAIHGVANAMRDPTVGALIAEDGGEKAVASTFAWYHTAKQLAGSIGKAAAGVILALTASNFSMVFIIAFALSLLPLATIVRFVRPVPYRPRLVPHAPGAQVGQPAPAAQSRVRTRSILPFVGFGFLVSGVSDMLANLFPILATKYAGLSAAQAGFVYVASTVVLIGAGPAFGWLSDNVSRKLVLSVRGVANVCSSLLYIVAPTFVGMAIGKITDDAGKAAYRPAWGSIMAHVSSFDRAHRAQLISWMTMGEDLGSALAPMLAGFVWSVWGIPAMLSVRAVLALGTEIAAWRLPEPRSTQSGGAGAPLAPETN
ncbi:MAG TPA: MFS transporter, partial [Longimicrobiales bacterium]